MATSTPKTRSRGTFGNRLLDSLPTADRRRIGALLERERVEIRRVIYEPDAPIRAIYFPVDAVVSTLTTLSDGGSVEIATIGNEGMVGSAVVLGSDTMPARQFSQVQVPGELLRMDRHSFAGVLAEEDPFKDVIQRYLQALFSQVAQQVACNALHNVEERCSRWLLLTHDRVHADSFPITQEFLAQMLGVRRASVTLAAGALQHAGLIRYRRGEMVIVDRAGLEDASCECYRAVRDEFDRLLGPPRPSTSARKPAARQPDRRVSAAPGD